MRRVKARCGHAAKEKSEKRLSDHKAEVLANWDQIEGFADQREVGDGRSEFKSRLLKEGRLPTS